MSALGCLSLKDLLQVAVTVVLFATLAACRDQPRSTSAGPFDYGNCVEDIPEHVEGLQILAGPRSEAGIIRDMVPAVCSGHALFERMKASGGEVEAVSVVFRVVVEYTGEVIGVTIEGATGEPEGFLRQARDFVLNTDFVYWRSEDDADAEFLYPVHFGRYE
jgi:hypothetical protein